MQGSLAAVLRERIRRHGPLRLDQYMQACLFDPQHGYWRRANAIGAAGDFITAPEISQIFGELIGVWCAVVWQSMGRPVPLRLVELGPGRGTLMRDVLRGSRVVPQFSDALTVHMVEVSAQLAQVQRQALAFEANDPRSLGNAKITWHKDLERVPVGAAIVIANEFLDALPIRQLVLAEGTWRERVIDIAPDGTLRFSLGAEVAYKTDSPASVDSIAELRPGEDNLLVSLARREERHISLFIDYGPTEAVFGDTLQAVRRHTFVDPLEEPGSADLTAHVRFADLARKAQANGLGCDGPLTQSEFLGRLGIVERAAHLMAANPDSASHIEHGVQRLMSPTGMGQLYKAIAVRSDGLSPIVPFL